MLNEDALAEVLEELGTDQCTACEAEPYIIDALGFAWCKEHEFKGLFISWGSVHGWPALSDGVYAIAEGSWFWVQAVLVGEDEYIWLMLGAIEVTYGEKLVA